MSYRKPGQRVSGRFIILTVLLVGVLALFRLYTYYKGAAAPIPPGVTLGGIDFSSYKDRAEIREQMEPIFTQPIGVHFENQLLVLDPAQIGFTVHVDQPSTMPAATWRVLTSSTSPCARRSGCRSSNAMCRCATPMRRLLSASGWRVSRPSGTTTPSPPAWTSHRLQFRSPHRRW